MLRVKTEKLVNICKKINTSEYISVEVQNYLENELNLFIRMKYRLNILNLMKQNMIHFTINSFLNYQLLISCLIVAQIQIT